MLVAAQLGTAACSELGVLASLEVFRLLPEEIFHFQILVRGPYY